MSNRTNYTLRISKGLQTVAKSYLPVSTRVEIDTDPEPTRKTQDFNTMSEGETSALHLDTFSGQGEDPDKLFAYFEK